MLSRLVLSKYKTHSGKLILKYIKLFSLIYFTIACKTCFSEMLKPIEEKEISINMWHNELSIHVPCVSTSNNLVDLSRCFSVKIDIIQFNVNAL